MLDAGALALVAGASLSAAAAVAHLACIVGGAPAYRFMGAGEKMARAAEIGKLRPTLITLAISFILFGNAAYALAGSGLTAQLPLTKPAVLAICVIYVGRAIAFPLLKPAFPKNSQSFWLVSSAICLVMGLVHIFGLATRWSAL